MAAPGAGAYRHVYFSPHLDDVVLSCAGRIACQTGAGERVLVVTIFAGTAGRAVAPRRLRSALWAPFQDLAARRQEDRRALETLAADHRWFDYADAIQRHRKYASLTGITAPLHRREAPLQARVAAAIAAVSRRHPAATLYFPLGIGNHVDHQLVSAVGLERRRIESRQPCGVLFYEDTPYVCIPHLLAQRFEQAGIRAPVATPAPSALARARETRAALLAAPELGRHLQAAGAGARLLLLAYLAARFARSRAGARRRQWLTLSPELIDVDAVFAAKVSAIGCYRSQVRALFGNLDALQAVLRSCSPGAAGAALQERYWRPAAAAPGRNRFRH